MKKLIMIGLAVVMSLGLAGMAGRPDDQPLNVVQYALVFRVGVSHDASPSKMIILQLLGRSPLQLQPRVASRPLPQPATDAAASTSTQIYQHLLPVPLGLPN